MQFTIEKATLRDLPQLLELYEYARQFMKENGNESQWGLPSAGKKLWPSEEAITAKINAGTQFNCYAEENGIKKLAATFCFIIGDEPVYKTLYDGKWPDGDDEYGVIHCMASRIKGAGTFCLNWCFTKCPYIRIDTHPNNKPMQGFLKKNGFTYCGKIYMEEVQNDDKIRIAFWKKI